MTPPITKQQEEQLYNIFYVKGFLFGRDKLYKKSVELNFNISRRQVAEWLKKQEINQIFRPTKLATKTQPTVLNDIHKQIGVDLIDFRNKENEENRWILTAIDLFSKKAYAQPLPNKTNKAVVSGMKTILDNIDNDISSIRSDNGSEFISKEFKKLLQDRNIKQVFSLPHTPQSNGQVERFNGIIKRLIRQFLYINNSYDWVKNLQTLVDNYNSSYQETIKDTPNNVEEADEDKKKVVKDNIYKAVAGKLQKDIIPKEVVNKTVRIKHDETPWSSKIYTIEKVFQPKDNIGKTYFKLHGLKKKFYYNDIQIIGDIQNSIDTPEKYEVSKLVRPSVVEGVPGYYVKWKGYLKDTDITWQSREFLLEDIPNMVRTFDNKHSVQWKNKRFTWNKNIE